MPIFPGHHIYLKMSQLFAEVLHASSLVLSLVSCKSSTSYHRSRGGVSVFVIYPTSPRPISHQHLIRTHTVAHFSPRRLYSLLSLTSDTDAEHCSIPALRASVLRSHYLFPFIVVLTITLVSLCTSPNPQLTHYVSVPEACKETFL